MAGWWRWALVSLDGVVPSRMVGVSASVNLPLHRKVQKFSSGTGSLGWSRKKGGKTVVVCVCVVLHLKTLRNCLCSVGQVHQLTHAGVKPYACPVCGRLHITSSRLSAHLRTHSEEKHYG